MSKKKEIKIKQDIINVTEELSTNYRVVFNPGMIIYKDNIFMLSYRIYQDMKYLKINKYPKWKDKGHPWKSNWQGHNKVGVAFIKILPNNLKSYNILHNQVLDIEEKPANIISGPEDMRLFRDDKNNIYGIFNIANSETLSFRKSKINKIKNDTRTIYSVKINVNPKTLYCKSEKIVPLCLEHSTGIEKNWSPFLHKNKKYITNFQFDDSSIHHIYKINSFETGKCDTKKIINYVPFFNIIKRIYPTIRFSGGSQSIKYNNKEYISIGHIVITFTKQIGSGVSQKVLKKYQSKDKQRQVKYYYMFFYTFDINKPFNILRISQPFQPYTSENYGIFFPTGILKKDKYIYISYGESDNYVKIMKLSIKDVNRMLKKIENITIDNYNFIEFTKTGKMKQNIITQNSKLTTLKK